MHNAGLTLGLRMYFVILIMFGELLELSLVIILEQQVPLAVKAMQTKLQALVPLLRFAAQAHA